MPSFPSPSHRRKPPPGPNFAAAGIILASSVAVGAALGDIARRDPDWRLLPAQDKPVPPASVGQDLVAIWFVLGMTFVGLHAFTKWVRFYDTTGHMMSLEELERSYQ